MNLAGFCRNCMSKWYRAEAEKRGENIADEDVRELIYGMPYGEWKENHVNAELKAIDHSGRVSGERGLSSA